jgi:hypothetical protein
MTSPADPWPPLPYADWAETAETLHLWTQVVGKVRLALATPVNHWWHVALYVDSRGLTTSAIPCGDRAFAIAFDFIDHRLVVSCSDGALEQFPLEPQSVARFHARLMAALDRIGVRAHVWTTPCEIADPIPFEQDEAHHSYDPRATAAFWRVLLSTSEVLATFRRDFLGKASPIHFFWGSFDLALTLFSGRTAPPHPGSPLMPARIAEEAYSHEVASFGFWPGGGGADASFYAYAYPEPEGFAAATVQPGAARYDKAFGEFLLPYEAVRTAVSPTAELLAFYRGAYAAAADHADWPRAALERGG